LAHHSSLRPVSAAARRGGSGAPRKQTAHREGARHPGDYPVPVNADMPDMNVLFVGFDRRPAGQANVQVASVSRDQATPIARFVACTWGDMDAEHVQAEPSPSRAKARSRRIRLPFALVMVGIFLVDIAVLGLQGSFSLTIAAPSYGNLTVHCGTLANATSTVPTVRLSNGSRAKLKPTGSGAEYVVALEKLKNSCRIAGQLRFDASITVGVLGLAAVLAGFAVSGRNKAEHDGRAVSLPHDDGSAPP